MSLYLIIYLILLLIALFTFLLKKESKLLYYFCFLLLTIMLCFRFGQGTDYFSYAWIYHMAPDSLTFNDMFYTDIVHSEIGWKIINHFFKVINFSFENFILVLSIFEMLCINRFIKKYCPIKCLALLLIYPTLYLTYLFSTLRQGIVICIFLGFLLDLFIEKKYFKYTLATVFLGLIHSSAFILLCAFIIVKFNLKTIYKVLALASVIGILFTLGALDPIVSLVSKIGTVNYYLKLSGGISISYLALLERLFFTALVIYMFSIYQNKDENNTIEILVKLYLLGTLLYLLFFWNDQIASRICYIFKPIEISLITIFIQKLEKFKTILILIIMFISTLMVIKNINSYIVQGQYNPNITFLNYPYISRVNHQEIYKIRKLNSVYLID